MKFSTKSCAIMALLMAICIILTRFLSFYVPIAGLSAVRVGFGSIPIVIAGLLFGPIAGLVVGGVSDILGAVFFSGLGFFPGYTLSPVIIGMLAPYIAKFTIKDNINYGKMAITLLPGDILATANTTFWFSYTTHTNFLILFLPKLATTIVLSLITSFIILKLYYPVRKYAEHL